MPRRKAERVRRPIRLTALAALLALGGCKQQANGVYVEITLKNDADIDRYVMFNPNLKSVEECEATFAQALPGVMANLPAAIPKNSTATGWKCSLEDPTKTAKKK
jgi:hypothetical protein